MNGTFTVNQNDITATDVRSKLAVDIPIISNTGTNQCDAMLRQTATQVLHNALTAMVIT